MTEIIALDHKDTIAELQRRLVTNVSESYGFGSKEIVPQITCKDGTTLSVQASKSHYCSPRDNFGPWGAVEVGFPSESPTGRMLECAENPEKPTETVYGYVPILCVAEFIDFHGGMTTDWELV